MERITQKDLDRILGKINTMAGMPNKYSFDQAYNGIKLVETANSGDVSIGGFESKKTLYNFMQGFLHGLIHAKG